MFFSSVNFLLDSELACARAKSFGGCWNPHSKLNWERTFLLDQKHTSCFWSFRGHSVSQDPHSKHQAFVLLDQQQQQVVVDRSGINPSSENKKEFIDPHSMWQKTRKKGSDSQKCTSTNRNRRTGVPSLNTTLFIATQTFSFPIPCVFSFTHVLPWWNYIIIYSSNRKNPDMLS